MQLTIRQIHGGFIVGPTQEPYYFEGPPGASRERFIRDLSEVAEAFHGIKEQVAADYERHQAKMAEERMTKTAYAELGTL